MNTGLEHRLAVAFFAASLFTGIPAMAAPELPETSPEGMVLLKDTEVRAVYAMPGASLDQYTRVGLLDCEVAFVKNWQRNQNRNSALPRHVDAQDMERIKDVVAEEFRAVFVEELQDKRGLQVVDFAGEDVLLVRPAIVNLDVTAPDTNSATISRSFVASAGQMTLYMELYDSVTGAIIARIVDPQAADRRGIAMRANRVSNRIEADRILRRWAGLLGDHLGDVQTATSQVESD